jgi:multiple sugar transport system permease protein
VGYALLMFIPFVWSLVTSFKTLPDSVRLTIIPDPFTLAAYDTVFNSRSVLPRLFFNSGLIAAVVTVSNVVLRSIAGMPLRGCGSRSQLIFLVSTPDDPGPADWCPSTSS